MLDRFKKHLEDSQIIPPGARVVVGYSGGADSTCLLHLAHAAGLEVIGAHLHHSQRAEADAEQERCNSFCQGYQIPFATGKADVPALAAAMKIGLEEAGREARYHFLKQTASQLGADLIATAHTRDDQIETVLFHLARGTGIGGLAGIPERRDNIVRPLLPFSRAETTAYCCEHGFEVHDDPSNSDLNLSRARMRHRVLPELRQVHPGFDQSVLRLSGLAGEEDRFLNGAAAAALERAEKPLNGHLRFLTLDCEAAFEVGLLLALPRVLLRRAILLATQAVGGNCDFESANRLSYLIASQERGSWTFEPGTSSLQWHDGVAHWSREEPQLQYREGLAVPGETSDMQTGWRITAFPSDDKTFSRDPRSLEAVCDSAAIKGGLYARQVNSDDRVHPAGRSSGLLAKKLMASAHMTRAARQRLPMVCDLLGPIWLPGLALADRVKLTEGTKTALRLRFGAFEP